MKCDWDQGIKDLNRIQQWQPIMKPKPYLLIKDGKPTTIKCAYESMAVGKCIRLNKVTDSKWTWEKRDE